MCEESNETISKIENLCNKYEKEAQILSKPVQFITRPYENEVNSDISSVFLQVSKILRNTISQSSDNSSSSSPEIAVLNTQLNELTKKLDDRSKTFYRSLESADQIINGKLAELEKAYQDKTSKIISENNDQKAKIEQEIQDINDSFDAKLKEELSTHLNEQSEMQSKLMRLKSNYEKTNQNLITSVTNAKGKIEELEKQKIDYQDESKALQMEESLSNLENEYQQKIEEKKKEQQKLNEELNSIQTYYNSELKRLQDLLDQVEMSANEKIKKSLDVQYANHQQMKSKLETEFKKKELELKRLIEKEEQVNSVSVQKLKSDIEEQKKSVKDAHDRYKNALHELESKVNAQLAERELEKQGIEKTQAKTLKQMASRHREQLAMLKKENDLARSELEQRIQNNQSSPTKSQLQQQSPKKANPSSNLSVTADPSDNKPVYQPTLPSAPQAGMKTAPRRRYSKKASTIVKKPPPSTSRVYLSETSSCNSDYDNEISERMNNFNFASNMESETFSRAVDAVQKKSIYNSEISRLGVSRAKRRLEQLQQEKENLAAKLKLLSEKSATDSQNDSESKLQSRISSQYSVIMDLKNTIQRLKNEKPSKVELSTIQAEHKKELEKMRSRLTTIENSNKKKIQKVRDGYAKKIQNEIETREKRLAEINQRIEELTEDAKKANEIVNEATVKEHQDWMKMRKDISDSTHRIMANIQQNGDAEVPRTPQSVQMPPMEPKSFLPLLKH